MDIRGGAPQQDHNVSADEDGLPEEQGVSPRGSAQPGPSKPKTYNGDLPTLPAELEPLTSLIAWMLWRWEKRKGKWTKPPLRPDGRRYASSTEPSTWSSYEA